LCTFGALEAAAARFRTRSDLATELLQLGILLLQLGILLVEATEEAELLLHLHLMLPLYGRETSMDRELLLPKGWEL